MFPESTANLDKFKAWKETNLDLNKFVGEFLYISWIWSGCIQVQGAYFMLIIVRYNP